MKLSVPNEGFVSVKVYNIKGQIVEVLMEGVYDANLYSITWEASQLSSGVYFIKAESMDLISTQKVILLK